MQPETPKLLEDVRSSASYILRVTRGKELGDYLTEELLKPAVERHFEKIGEALVRPAKRDPETAAKIADCSRIIAFRNVLIHAYDAIDDSRVWDAVQNSLPQLYEEVMAMLPEPKD
jgi:uncharacterized protein with HEPN domain